MPIFADFPMLPLGSADDHARYAARFNYRYYCVQCIRSIESVARVDKCVHCSSTNLILLMQKEVKEKQSWQQRLAKFLKALSEKRPAKPGFSFRSGEELPTK